MELHNRTFIENAQFIMPGGKFMYFLGKTGKVYFAMPNPRIELKSFKEYSIIKVKGPEYEHYTYQ